MKTITAGPFVWGQEADGTWMLLNLPACQAFCLKDCGPSTGSFSGVKLLHNGCFVGAGPERYSTISAAAKGYAPYLAARLLHNAKERIQGHLRHMADMQQIVDHLTPLPTDEEWVTQLEAQEAKAEELTYVVERRWDARRLHRLDVDCLPKKRGTQSQAVFLSLIKAQIVETGGFNDLVGHLS